MADNLGELTKAQLMDRAKRAGIEGRSRMDKKQLMRALRNGGDGRRTVGRRRQSPETTKRAIWRGAITFGLITIPVGLYSAVENRDISFHLLSERDGSRIRFKRVSAKTGREVEWENIVKGYEYEPGGYVTFTHEELERIPSDSIRAIDVVQFAAADEIDPIFFDSTYYLGPEESGMKAYALFARALESSDRVGVAKVTIREKERICTLRAVDGVLILETMHWPDEIRTPAFDVSGGGVRVSAKEVDMAAELIDRLTAKFDPDQFSDSYRARLEEAIRAKIEGEEIQLAPEEPEQAKVIDLLDALKASVEATRKRSA